MIRALTTAPLLLAMTGCIFYREGDKDDDFFHGDTADFVDETDEPKPVDTFPSEDSDTDVVDTDAPDTDVVDTDTEPPAPKLAIDPSAARPGDVLIVAFTSPSGTVDLSHLDSVQFFPPEGLEILTTRGGSATRFLVTLQVEDDAAAGPRDVLALFDDQTAIWLDDGFEVLAP